MNPRAGFSDQSSSHDSLLSDQLVVDFGERLSDELLKQAEIVAFLGFFHQQREISNLPVALLIQGFGEPAVFAPSEDASASSEKDHPA